MKKFVYIRRTWNIFYGYREFLHIKRTWNIFYGYIGIFIHKEAHGISFMVI